MGYATKQSFGGQRASVGQSVVVADGGDIRAGVIVAIENDEPLIRVLGAFPSHDCGTFSPGGFRFGSCANESELLALPNGFWTWPPRV